MRVRKPKPAQAPNLDHIHPQLRHLAVEIGLLTLDPENAREHPEPNLDAIKGSLARFGQRKAIVVRKQGMVVEAGNGTVVAAKQLGWTHVAAVVVDESETEAMAFALADNRSGELAGWDYERLIGQFSTLTDGGVDMTALGWTAAELASLMNSDFTPPQVGDMPDITNPRLKTLAFKVEEYERIAAAHEAGRLDANETVEQFVLRVVCER